VSKYYEKCLTEFNLNSDFSMKSSINEIETGANINFTDFNKFFEANKNIKQQSKLDMQFSELLYKAISTSNLDQKFVYDFRFWQWICLNPLREFCIWRWDIDLESDVIQTPERFLGGGSVTGFSKNSASRLYFPASILINEPKVSGLKDGATLFESFWKKQQKELSICQSILSMDKNIFIAAVRAADGLSTEEIKRLMADLNFRSSSTFLDVMSHEEIYDISQN
tara:strand:- start:508 stop:1179 length:672 start_codon:yes stop_codon:yes gene_type:complete